MAKLSRLPCPRLTLVTDLARFRLSLPQLVEAAIAGGIDAIQIRAPELPPAARRDLAETLLSVTFGRALLIINNEPALAVALSVGLHQPERAAEPPPEHLRFVSRAVHTPSAAAAADQYDAIIAGHIFVSASKRGQTPIGLNGLQAIVKVSNSPVVAIGGINEQNAGACILAGAKGVAVIGSISEASDPCRAASRIRQAVDAALVECRRNDESERTLMSTDPTASTIPVALNGKHEMVAESCTVLDVLTSKSLRPELVAVEYNGEILPRDRFATTVLHADDQLEIVHFVGGG